MNELDQIKNSKKVLIKDIKNCKTQKDIVDVLHLRHFELLFKIMKAKNAT